MQNSNIKSQLLFLVFFAFLVNYILASNNTLDSLKKQLDNQLSIEEKISTIIELGLEEYNQSNYDVSEKYFLQAQQISLENSDTVGLLRSKLNISQLLKNKGLLDSALENYFEVINLALLTEDYEREALGYYNVGTIYFKLQDNLKAMEYILKSLKMYEKLKDDSRIGNCFVVKAIIERNQEKYNLAKESLVAARMHYERVGNEKGIAYCYGNLGTIHTQVDNFSEALKCYLKSAEYKEKTHDQLGMALVYGNIAGAYFNLNNNNKGLIFLDSSMALARELEAKSVMITNYLIYIEYYKEIKNYNKLTEAYQDYIYLKEEILKEESKRNTIALEEKFLAEKQVIQANIQIELLEEQNRNRSLKFTSLGVIVILILIFSLLIYLKQRRIISSEKKVFDQENNILEAKYKISKQELEKADLEKKNLENELNYKKKELLTFSLYINSLRGLESNIKQEIDHLKTSNNDQKRIVENINSILNTHKGNQGNITELYKRIESINESFYFKIKKKHEILTEDDLRLASLLLLNLSSKEISNLLFITPKSVDMKRYRLRKKLTLDSNDDLLEYLRSV